MSNLKQTVSDLKKALGSGAKPSNFAVEIGVPIILKGISSVNSLINRIPVVNKIVTYTGNRGLPHIPQDHIKVLAKNATLPGKTVNTIDVWDRGHKYVMRDVADFDHRWSVTFYNTEDMGLRQVFEAWMYELDRFDSSILRTPFLTNNMGVGTPKFMANINPGYMADIFVSQLNCAGDETVRISINNAFPVELSAIQLDSSQPNAISEFTVTFAYTSWTRV